MSDIKGLGDSFLSGVRSKLQMAELKSKVETAQNLKASEQGSAEELEKAKEAATQFESVLVQQMLKSMWQSVPKSGLITGSYEEELYQEMLQKQISEHISEHQSFGIKDMVLREMTEKSGYKGD